MEAGTFEEYIRGVLGRSRFEAAEYTCDAHRVFGVADHEVAVRKLVLLSVEGDEGRTVGAGPHDNPAAFDLVGIKRVHGHSCLEEDVVGDIDDIVDGTQADGDEAVLQPFGRLLDGNTGDGEAGVARTSLGIINLDGDGLVAGGDGLVGLMNLVESLDGWLGQRVGKVMGAEVGVEVAGHAEV